MQHIQYDSVMDECAFKGLGDIEAQVRRFEREERRRLGLNEKPEHWHDPCPETFTREQRTHTTILFNGITLAHDVIIETGLAAMGYNIQVLDTPDNDALQLGKEYGNRGQCNPTYYTVGNLIKYLDSLYKEEGLSKQEIVKRYILLTVGACGPCRFGMYKTENRKALRDAGYDGFRIIFFQNAMNFRQSHAEAGLALTPRFFITLLKCIMAGDVLNAMGYRIRPYETEQGETDKVLKACRQRVCQALLDSSSLLKALYDCKRLFKSIALDRLQARPKVSVIGEFWAMTTEGEGNYALQRFLESEGAEVEVQPVTGWIMYKIWEAEYNVRERMLLRRQHEARRPQVLKPFRTLLMIKLTKWVMKASFCSFSWALGLRHYHLSDMEENASLSKKYYLNELRGGEGHMEVGKVIQSTVHRKANLVISVKPFGCMPSSCVSDGVQSKVLNDYPDAHFLAVETTGDGAVSVYSRVQMEMFRARQRATEELNQALQARQLGATTVRQRSQGSAIRHCASKHPAHKVASTAANLVYGL
ncbi:MAG: hypothetical protein BMS9Abin36_1875 [Gammaproteobacteria bacterium]|nr:MAG: hypothetical protein BMS9Abin36_1875 [Gammaproteobacteria bacterium]